MERREMFIEFEYIYNRWKNSGGRRCGIWKLYYIYFILNLKLIKIIGYFYICILVMYCWWIGYGFWGEKLKVGFFLVVCLSNLVNSDDNFEMDYISSF